MCKNINKVNNNTFKTSYFHKSSQMGFISDLRSKSLQKSVIPNRFHYESWYQSQLWLEVNKAYAPIHDNLNIELIYKKAFKYITKIVSKHDGNSNNKLIHIVGIGSGNGLKEKNLIKFILHSFRRNKPKIIYTGIETSNDLAILASNNISKLIGKKNCTSLIGDYTYIKNLNDILDIIEIHYHKNFYKDDYNKKQTMNCNRIFTLFGISPNTKPKKFFNFVKNNSNRTNNISSQKMKTLTTNSFIYSLNLVPTKTSKLDVSNKNYSKKSNLIKNILKSSIEINTSNNSVTKNSIYPSVFSQYSNKKTKIWLNQCLRDWGIFDKLKSLKFVIMGKRNPYKIIYRAKWKEDTNLNFGGKSFSFKKNDPLKIFTTYRYNLDEFLHPKNSTLATNNPKFFSDDSNQECIIIN